MTTFSIRPSQEQIERYRTQGAWRSRTIVDDVFRWAAETPDADAIIDFRNRDGLVKLTYRELADRVRRFSAALAELGVGSGGVVAIQLPNWWQALALELACWDRGAVLASIMITIRGRELERMLARVQPSVFITTDEWDGYQHAAAVAEMSPRLSSLQHRVVLGEEVKDDEVDFVQFFFEQSHPKPTIRPADPDAVALVLFTSGTTGEPKAVLRTLNNQYAQLRSLLERDGEKLRCYTPQSLMHAAGLNVVTFALLGGGAVLLVEQWEPRRVAALLAETGIDWLFLVPPFLRELLAVTREDGVQLPELRRITASGTAVPAELVAETLEVLDTPLLGIWAMTEGGLTSTAPDDPPDWAARSIGRPGSDADVQLRPVVADGSVTEGNPGRLMIRGAGVCLATIGRDSGTLRVLAEHEDGWYDTGDLAVPDGRDGYPGAFTGRSRGVRVA